MYPELKSGTAELGVTVKEYDVVAATMVEEGAAVQTIKFA